MNKAITIFGTMLALTACASAPPLMASGFNEDRQSVKVLIMEPDINVIFMTTTGPEPRADWTETAETNLMTSVIAELENGGETVIMFDPDTEMKDQVEQALLLNQSVTATIRNHVGMKGSPTLPFPLPHKEGNPFDYTIGDAISGLTENYDADYALFLTSNSSFNSSGIFFRNLAIGVATMGNYIPIATSIRGTFVTLVDIETGQVVWVDGVSSGDPRQADSAKNIAQGVFSTSPLN